MANINKFIPFILKWEGGFVKNPADLGGATNMGVTLKTWQDCGYDKNGDGIIDEEDLKLIFQQDLIECVLKPHYWDRWQADRIHNQSVANLLVDWIWISGTTGIKTPQQVLNLQPDGIVGEKTLTAINDYPDQRELFERLKTERIAYIERICSLRPANKRFEKGWLNRLNDIKFMSFILVFFLLTCFASCKSTPLANSARMDTQTVLNSEKESEERMISEWNRMISKQSDSIANTETVMKIVTVRFDTSSIDSISGQHPIKEVSKTIVNQGKRVYTSIVEGIETNRIDSSTVHSTEKVMRKDTANIQQKTAAISSSRYKLYIFLILIIVLIGLAWFFKRKISNFFLR